MPEALTAVLCYNTCHSTEKALNKFPKERSYDVLLVNDGSTDNTGQLIRRYDYQIIEHPTNKGLGAAIKTAIKYGFDHDYEFIVIMAGNGKDNPLEIPRLLRPLKEENYDYVQGTRFLKGGSWDNLPIFRYTMIKIYGYLLTLFMHKKITDPLNGFRAYRLDILNDDRINIWQDWLNHYEYETYLNFNVLKFGFKYKEVPVSKLYPARKKKAKYTHIRPFLDWWSILRPIPLLLFNLKK